MVESYVYVIKVFERIYLDAFMALLGPLGAAARMHKRNLIPAD